MRNYLMTIFVLLLLFCQCGRQKRNSYFTELPNDSLINDVIYSTILLDSLRLDYNIGKHIFIPNIYKEPRWDKKTPPPPPPPSKYSYSFDELYKFFNSENDSKLRLNDSLFIIRQIDTTLNYKLSDRVISLFNNKEDEFYYFSLPIFSRDKKTALIEYANSQHSGVRTILKKEESEWKLVSHETTWMR
ncbi:MAG: hypothetical protein AB9846_08560 [Tenuifilaceae bacterium]